MDTNSKQSPDKTHLRTNCRIIGVLFGLFAFIWLPTPEVDAASRIFGIVRDANTKNPLSGVTITVNDVFSTESNGPPDVGEYSIDYLGCNFSLRAELSGYEPFETDRLFLFCPSEFEFQLDIELTSVIPLSSLLQLDSPEPGEQIRSATVFRWTQSDHLDVSSYRLIIAEDENMETEVLRLPDDLPEPDNKPIIAPQIAVRSSLLEDFDFTGKKFFWRVIALDESGNPLEQSQISNFLGYVIVDGSGFTVISGLVKSDLNQAALVGARVEVSSGPHVLSGKNIIETVFNGAYIVIAVTSDSGGEKIDFPLQITATHEGFRPRVVDDLQDEDDDGKITLDLPMIADFDGDIAAGDFTGDGKADVASIRPGSLWYQDGDTLAWTKIPGGAPDKVTAGDVTGDGRAEIIGTWTSGIWYRDVAESSWTQMTTSVPAGYIAAGDFTGDGKADVASIWSSGLWYQDGANLAWTKVSSAPGSLTAGDVTGDGRAEIIGTWRSGIWYWDVAASNWTQMHPIPP